MKTGKRILEVKIVREIDIDPDTSYLGEYSDRASTEFAIVRRGYGRENQFRYFNAATIEPCQFEAGMTSEQMEQRKAQWRKEMHENARADYDRMEAYTNENWRYIGVRAEAKIVIQRDIQSNLQRELHNLEPIQTITSGGLWGIESDSDRSYFAEVESEELSELRTQLKAIGFSTRAISTAFKNAEHVKD